jgi:hypothetical protein
MITNRKANCMFVDVIRELHRDYCAICQTYGNVHDTEFHHPNDKMFNISEAVKKPRVMLVYELGFVVPVMPKCHQEYHQNPDPRITEFLEDLLVGLNTNGLYCGIPIRTFNFLSIIYMPYYINRLDPYWYDEFICQLRDSLGY